MEMWEKYFQIKDDAADKHTQNQQWTPTFGNWTNDWVSTYRQFVTALKR